MLVNYEQFWVIVRSILIIVRSRYLFHWPTGSQFTVSDNWHMNNFKHGNCKTKDASLDHLSKLQQNKANIKPEEIIKGSFPWKIDVIWPISSTLWPPFFLGSEYDTKSIYSAIQKQTVVRPHIDCEYFDGKQYIKVGYRVALRMWLDSNFLWCRWIWSKQSIPTFCIMKDALGW